MSLADDPIICCKTKDDPVDNIELVWGRLKYRYLRAFPQVLFLRLVHQVLRTYIQGQE